MAGIPPSLDDYVGLRLLPTEGLPRQERCKDISLLVFKLAFTHIPSLCISNERHKNAKFGHLLLPNIT